MNNDGQLLKMRLLRGGNRGRAEVGAGKGFRAPFAGLDPTYLRYHAELFAGNELSCWGKYLMETEYARIRARAA